MNMKQEDKFSKVLFMSHQGNLESQFNLFFALLFLVKVNSVTPYIFTNFLLFVDLNS